MIARMLVRPFLVVAITTTKPMVHGLLVPLSSTRNTIATTSVGKDICLGSYCTFERWFMGNKPSLLRMGAQLVVDPLEGEDVLRPGKHGVGKASASENYNQQQQQMLQPKRKQTPQESQMQIPTQQNPMMTPQRQKQKVVEEQQSPSTGASTNKRKSKRLVYHATAYQSNYDANYFEKHQKKILRDEWSANRRKARDISSGRNSLGGLAREPQPGEVLRIAPTKDGVIIPPKPKRLVLATKQQSSNTNSENNQATLDAAMALIAGTKKQRRNNKTTEQQVAATTTFSQGDELYLKDRKEFFEDDLQEQYKFYQKEQLRNDERRNYEFDVDDDVLDEILATKEKNIAAATKTDRATSETNVNRSTSGTNVSHASGNRASASNKSITTKPTQLQRRKQPFDLLLDDA